MVREARLIWTASGSAGGETALYFTDGASNSDIAGVINAFALAVRPALASTTSITVPNLVREINTATGALQAEGALGAIGATVGTGGATAVPNAAQGLIRYRTATVVGGRFLQGRLYVPGMAAATMTATGEVNPTGQAALAAGGAALVIGGFFGVWHRPKGGAGGVHSILNSSSAWSEFAVQRRRRS